MTAPSSFSTMCTSNCAFELIGLLLSLSLFHPDAQVYILTDTKTKQIISEIPTIQLIASGGITHFSDLQKVASVGCEGAIIGKAIYEGIITLKQLEQYILSPKSFESC